MKHIVIGLLFLSNLLCVQILSAEQIYVMHGQLSSDGDNTFGENESVWKYEQLQAGIGDLLSDTVLVEFGTRTVDGELPENAILITTHMEHLDLEEHNIMIGKIIGLDVTIGLLEYTDDLWAELIQMSQDELLAYCTPANPVSFDEAVSLAIEFIEAKVPEATDVRLDDANTEENCRHTLTWLLGIRVELAEEGLTLSSVRTVEVNVRGFVVAYSPLFSINRYIEEPAPPDSDPPDVVRK
ncbi:MAG: hypothetical protein PHY48_16570 [Candidatus Cloacimonetes bacterium]|nr:hypothetical protein [Candidatus Cloacimonadota bacterium]